MRVGIVGASGFLGSHVLHAGRAAGIDARPIAVARVTRRDERVLTPAKGSREPAEPLVLDLMAAVTGCDVVVNAAGLARPNAPDDAALLAANVILPAAVALACARAGVRRLVHVSSAAVQGRTDPLDETHHVCPFSPYSRSKAAAERWLHDHSGDLPGEVVVYRPASVHGRGRGITRMLCRVARGPLVPLAGRGEQPLPVALVENVAAGILFAATWPAVLSPVVQPWEGLTTRRLFELLGTRRFLFLPGRPAGWGVAVAGRWTRFSPRLASSLRTLDLLYRGQRVGASSLTLAGFVLPVGVAGWAALCDPTAKGQSVESADWDRGE